MSLCNTYCTLPHGRIWFRYLTDREKKLQSRQKKFNEILDQENNLKSWKQRILDEEKKLKLEIKKALRVKDLNISESEISHPGWLTFLETAVLETPVET